MTVSNSKDFELDVAEYVEEAFDVGEVSFHTGWTYHRAGPNQSVNSPRRVMTVIYMDKDILINDDVAEDDDDHKIWLNAKQPGSIADGPLNPILYELK